MRGCDWPRMAVRSLTVSSPSPSRARMRSRVGSPAAFRADKRGSTASRGWGSKRDIKISLCLFDVGSKPRTLPLVIAARLAHLCPEGPENKGEIAQDDGQEHQRAEKREDLAVEGGGSVPDSERRRHDVG